MANQQNPAPSTTTNPPITDATRGADALSLDRLRVAVPIVDHAAQLAAQTRVEEADRKVAALVAQVAELEASASKAAVVGQAQQHELALVDRKHSLEMARMHQQWALDDARKARERQLAESDRALGATVEAQRIAWVRRDCDAINQQNVELHAAIASEESRITIASMAYGLAFGALTGGAGAMWSRQRGEGAKHGPGIGFVGVGGALTATVPILAQYFKPTAPQLPTPVNAAGWDAYQLALTADNAGLRNQLAALRVTTISWPVAMAAAAGVGSLTYAIAS